MISLEASLSSSNRIPKALLWLPQFDGEHVEADLHLPLNFATGPSTPFGNCLSAS